ncbi:MgtC/SapB family protein [Anaerospora hongkongensis]|uniref:MgtC/SapB family protein n=1 Tax=Anaerospora hongkongensis TaxID=244830 RepID=UPI0028A06236|nr:MgtC/SapB family protein [Anaerospora hongkongensis]
MVLEIDTLMRLSVAFVLGGLIGYERQSQSKAAGLRTHVLVCLGSCLVMILSLNIYQSVQGLTNADPARLAAQVVSGVGFLGAGTIMKEGATVTGLTTAASLWVVSGVGLAVGCGYYSGAFYTTFLILLTLALLLRIDKLHNAGQMTTLLITVENKAGQMGKIGDLLGACGVRICDIRIDAEGEQSMVISVALNGSEQGLINKIAGSLLAVEGVISVKSR